MPLYQSSEDILNAIQAENRSVNVSKNCKLCSYDVLSAIEHMKFQCE